MATLPFSSCQTIMFACNNTISLQAIQIILCFAKQNYFWLSNCFFLLCQKITSLFNRNKMLYLSSTKYPFSLRVLCSSICVLCSLCVLCSFLLVTLACICMTLRCRCWPTCIYFCWMTMDAVFFSLQDSTPHLQRGGADSPHHCKLRSSTKGWQ